MGFMNDFDIVSAQARFARAGTPNRLRAAQIIARLAEWTDENSDGWAYWTKPRNAARSLVAMVESTTNAANDAQERNDVSDDDLARALMPVRRFLTSYAREHKPEELAELHERILVGSPFEVAGRYSVAGW